MSLNNNHLLDILDFFQTNIGHRKKYWVELRLNEKQIKAVMYVKEKGKITNKEYRKLNSVSNKTAYFELSELVKKGIFVIAGTGKNTIYKVTKR